MGGGDDYIQAVMLLMTHTKSKKQGGTLQFIQLSVSPLFFIIHCLII